MMQPEFKLLSLGQLRLVDGAGNTISFPEKGLLILAHARLNGWERKSRTEIARQFWSDVDQAQASANLRKTISRINDRQAQLGFRPFEFDDRSVTVSLSAFRHDIDELTHGESVAPLDHFLKLAGLLQEDFLADIRVHDQALNSWIEVRRNQCLVVLRDAFLSAAEAVPDAHRSVFKAVAMRLLDRNPDDETVRAAITSIYDYQGHEQENRGSDNRGLPNGARGKLAAEAAATAGQIDGETRRPPRMVLLPPKVSGNSVDAYGAALVEDVTIGLCALRSVSVLAPYTAAQIASRANKSQSYERHAISYVLETRITDEAQGHTLFAQLIFFGNDEIVWADRFNIAEAGLIHSRRDLASKIASAISRQVERNELQRLFFEENAAAYKHFLIGQQTLTFLDLARVRRARGHFREALKEQASFAPALSGLARSFFFEWLLTARGDSELLSLAERHANDAITANSSLAPGYRELGVVKLYQRQYDESIAFLSTAEKLSPNHANILASHADTLVQASQPAEGLEKIKAALDLNPLAPDEYFWTAAGASYSLEKYEDALGYIDQMKDKLPADRLAAASWGMLGNVKKAKQFVASTFEVHPDFSLEKWMSIVPFKEDWQKAHYLEGLKSAGFK
jgi:DNA-binding SARP family transcriptional activator